MKRVQVAHVIVVPTVTGRVQTEYLEMAHFLAEHVQAEHVQAEQ